MIVAAAGIYFLVVIDVFGLDRETRRISQDMGQRLMAPFYKGNNDNILVVVFDNDYFTDKTGWPATFRDHSLILNRISSFSPKAVFYDIFLSRKPNDVSGVDGFVRAIEAAKRRGISVLTPVDINDVVEPAVRKNTDMVATSWSGRGAFYPAQVNGTLTPAFRMAQIYRGKGDAQSPSKNYSEDMLVQWGLEPNPDRGLGEKISLSGRFVFKLGKEKEYALETFIKKINVKDLNRISREELRALIEGKFVMLGTNIDGVSDYIINPVHGRVAGVFLHAMALDNLVKYEKNYIKNGDTSGALTCCGVTVTIPDIIEVVVLLSNLALFAYAKYLITRIKIEGSDSSVAFKQARILLGFSIVSVLIIAAGFYATTGYFRYDTSNFIGLVSVDLVLYHWIEKTIESVLLAMGVKRSEGVENECL